MKLLYALVLYAASASAMARIPAAFDPIVVEAPFSFTEREFDLTPAFERARNQEKPLYVYLGAADCPPCHEYTRFLEANTQQLQPHFAKVVVVDIRSWLKGPKIVFRVYGKAYSPKEFQGFVGDTGAISYWPYRWLLSPNGVVLKHMPPGNDKYTNVENHIEALRVPTAAMGLMTTESVARAVATEQEIRDWGVAPIANVKAENLHSPTPTSIPGGKTILASELHDWLQSADKPIVIDVLGGVVSGRRGLPGALYMGSEIGAGRIGIEMRDRFRVALEKLTGGDKGKPLVFYCLNSQCWLSYNASRRAIVAGYTNVSWYRGGIEAWKERSYPEEQARGLLQW